MSIGSKEGNAVPFDSASGIILRTSLLKKMRDAAMKRNIYISAPGGYGKTVASRQWLASVRGRTATLTLDDTYNNQSVFCKRLAVALVKLTQCEKIAPDIKFTPDVLLEFIARLPVKHARCYLLLDDLHTIKNEDILGSLPFITAHLPGYIRVCIASRSAPSAALAGTDLFELLTQEDLLFSPYEVEWLGAEKNQALDLEQIQDLLQTTGGWAMYLSAILSGGYKKNELSGSLIQYLKHRVWSVWDKETKTLLIRLAVPTEVTPELCERLTGYSNGQHILERVIKRENAYLSPSGCGTYRFHDVFRDFLLARSGEYLGEEELRRLNDVAARWYYEQGRYFEGARHYIQNRDNKGVARCFNAAYDYYEKTQNSSIEVRIDYIRQYIMNLPAEFIDGSPHLLIKSAVGALMDGNAAAFERYADKLYAKMSGISQRNQSLMIAALLVSGTDYRTPFRKFVKRLSQTALFEPGTAAPKCKAGYTSLTQNLPFFHRSVRDFSEYYELKSEDFDQIAATYGIMLGDNYKVVEQLIIAGIYYERGSLLDAARHALDGYHACDAEMHPETIFCAHMILAAILYAMNAKHDACRIMESAEAFVKGSARFLLPNFKALLTERDMRTGNMSAAKDWLDACSSHAEQLPFYQIHRHFTTLRAHIALGETAQAVMLGKRLHALATKYNRPLDQIESGLLIAIALWNNGKKEAAATKIEKAVRIAMPYGFTQMFLNEGKEVLPILWDLREKSGVSSAIARFVEILIAGISELHGLKLNGERPLKLSAMRLKMLSYLEKGMSYKEIADVSGLAHGTVKKHVQLLYRQMDAHDAREALLKAKALGLIG